ncbi:MAG TPA: GNAT family N-acetyltransferase [Chryseosolibacter sp.]
MNEVPSTLLQTTMDESITIRVATLDDIEAIVSIGIRTFRDTFDEVNTAENMMLYLNSTFTIKRIAEEIREPNAAFFLAEQESEIIGYARVRSSVKPEGVGEGKAIEIERLYADKKFLGKRVGYLLMSECLQYARDNNAQWVWLGVWEHNERAIAFYKRWGFEKFSEHIFMLGNDAQTDWMMKKQL